MRLSVENQSKIQLSFPAGGWDGLEGSTIQPGNYCPCCESHAEEFLPYGTPARPRAQCPRCKSLERHRLANLYLLGATNLQDHNWSARTPGDGGPPRVLHMAPEPAVTLLWESVGGLHVIQGDARPRVGSETLRVDLTDTPFPDNYFDLVYCSHVLEHIEFDTVAMREILRVLKPLGIALLQVPIRGEHTDYDPDVRSPEDRLARYGQADHVRSYGHTDYVRALRDVGFIVLAPRCGDNVDPVAIRAWGLHSQERLYTGVKPGV